MEKKKLIRKGEKYVFRYMSEKEFNLVTSGNVIVGKRHFKARTNSSGICFLPAKVEFYSNGIKYEFTPEQCFEFLYGIVSDDVLVKFEVIDADLTESYGVYADPIDHGWFSRITITELCIPYYDREMLKPVAYAIQDPFAYAIPNGKSLDWEAEWKWFEYNG